MGKWPVVPRIYGYLVCFGAIAVTLVCLVLLVQAAFNLADPTHADELQPYYCRWNLSSFEMFKLDVLRSLAMAREKRPMPDDRAIRASYEGLKAQQIAAAIRSARTDLVLGSLLILACVVLFVTHWRWLHRLSGSEASTVPPPTP